MKVHVEEAKFTFAGVKYAITSDTWVLHAEKKVFSLQPNITVSDNMSSRATIVGESLLQNKFVITISDGRTFHYQREKLSQGVDVCEGDGGPYRLYEHKGVRYSIFRQDVQIAAFARKTWVTGSGHTYDLHVDPKADVVLVVCMVLCLNTERGDTNGNTWTYDFGNFGPEERAFDEMWHPSDEVAAQKPE